MFCKVQNKEVSITPLKEIKDSSGKVVKTYYDCTGNYIEVSGMKIHRICPSSKNKDCLLETT